MNKQFNFHNHLGLIVLVSNLLAFLLLLSTSTSVYAQTGPFLSTPYYGQTGINSYFDHKYPTYTCPPNGSNPNCGVPVDNTYPNVIVYTTAETSSCNPYCYDGHDGYDFQLSYAPVLAAASGVVSFANWNRTLDRGYGLGLYVEVEHADGYHTRYGHLSAISVKVGDTVQLGQIIGTSGNTGNSSGPHLHFGLLVTINSGILRAVDPFGWTGTPGTDPWQQYSTAQSTCLWKDGEWANYCGGVSRPIPQPVDGQQTLTVADRTDNQFGFSKGYNGIFNNQCSNDCGGWTRYGTYYSTSTNGTTINRWAKWQPLDMPIQGGIYEIQVLVPPDNATSWQAPYTIRNSSGTVIGSAVVDQDGLSNQWVTIGTYTLTPGANVYVTDASGSTDTGRQVAADDIRFIRRGTTYAPDVRHANASSSWQSSVILRNNGGTATYLAKTLDSTGGVLCSYIGTLATHAVGYVPLCTQFATSVASVVVDASQDVSVLVENRKAGEATNYSGIPAGNGSTGCDSTGTTLYIPTLKYGLYSRSGRIYLLNAGTTTTNLTVDLWRQDSNVHYSCGTSLVAQGRTTIDPAGCGGAQAGYLYGAKITSVSTGGSDPVDPLAAVVIEKNDSGAELQASTNAFAFGNGTNYSPLVKNSYYGNQATMVVQNIGSVATNVNVTYYFNGTTSSDSFSNLPAGSSHIFAPQNGGVPTGILASVRTISSGQPLVTALYENKTGASWRMQHSGFTAGSKVVILPKLVKNYNDGSLIWQSGYLVQNVGAVNTTVTVKYYNMDGTYAGYTPSFIVQPYRSSVVNLQDSSSMNSNWQGSALVVADQPIVISGNLTNNGSGDAAMSYSGVNR